MRTMPSLLCLAALLCAGCSNSNNDSAKIDALNKRLDWIVQSQSEIMSNQAALSARMDKQFTALPNMGSINEVSYFYYSNSLVTLGNEFKVQSVQIQDIHSAITNLQSLSAKDPAFDLLENDMAEIHSDLGAIKTKMGILY
jgi:hypothetical protein